MWFLTLYLKDKRSSLGPPYRTVSVCRKHSKQKGFRVQTWRLNTWWTGLVSCKDTNTVSLNTSTYPINDTAKPVPLQESVHAKRGRKPSMDSNSYRYFFIISEAFCTRLHHDLFCTVVKCIAKHWKYVSQASISCLHTGVQPSPWKCHSSTESSGSSWVKCRFFLSPVTDPLCDPARGILPFHASALYQELMTWSSTLWLTHPLQKS